MLTLFFCGWGMDERTVQHVGGIGDLLLFYDYRDIACLLYTSSCCRRMSKLMKASADWKGIAK